jgi:hypothetical protein
MAVPVPGLEGVDVIGPALAQINVGMVGGFFDHVMVQQRPEGWQEKDVQGDEYGQQKRGRCPVAFAPVALWRLPFSR